MTTSIVIWHTYEQSVNLLQKPRALSDVTWSLKGATALSVMEREEVQGRSPCEDSLPGHQTSAKEEQGDWGGPGESIRAGLWSHSGWAREHTQGPSEGHLHERKPLQGIRLGVPLAGLCVVGNAQEGGRGKVRSNHGSTPFRTRRVVCVTSPGLWVGTMACEPGSPWLIAWFSEDQTRYCVLLSCHVRGSTS